jgi:hypothetical protein
MEEALGIRQDKFLAIELTARLLDMPMTLS